MTQLTEIGKVISSFKEPADPVEMRKYESRIVVNDEYLDGLYRIEENKYLQVLFFCHKSSNFTLKGRRYHGEVKGVFASRSPSRPSPVGITTVELLSCSGNTLTVKGLDAIDGTPVIDLKPYSPGHDSFRDAEASADFTRNNPRGRIIAPVKNRDIPALLLMAGEFHGHFCPGVCLGVTAAVEGLYALGKRVSKPPESFLLSEGLEKTAAVVEINSCFADGVQVVTGCTLGNNELIYRDLGKTAVTIAERGGCGVRVSVRKGYRDVINSADERFFPLFEEVIANSSRDPDLVKKFKTVSREASFALAKIPVREIFRIEETVFNFPLFAPVKKSEICTSCSESVMAGKGVILKDQFYCRSCSGSSCFSLTGEGIINT